LTKTRRLAQNAPGLELEALPSAHVSGLSRNETNSLKNPVSSTAKIFAPPGNAQLKKRVNKSFAAMKRRIGIIDGIHAGDQF
jgi:hypothetical protein